MDSERLFSTDEWGEGERQAASPTDAAKPNSHLKPKYIPVNRGQSVFYATEIDHLIPADHLIRMIWATVQDLDVTQFEVGIRSRVELQGAPCWEPRVLITMLIYGYAIGVGAGRALARMMTWDPVMRWITADRQINYHTLTSFRTAHQEALKTLFVEYLAALEEEGLVDFQTLMQDGTKVRARASRSSFHRVGSIQERLQKAEAYMAELDRRGEREPAEELRQQRQKRELQGRVGRMKRALQVIAERGGANRRASVTEPEARVMKQAQGGGYAPSYNVQVVSDAKEGMIVGVRVSDAPADARELGVTMAQVEQETGKKPVQLVADSGYASRENIEDTARRGIELITPDGEDSNKGKGNLSRAGVSQEFHRAKFVETEDGQAVQCPAGKRLELHTEYPHHKVPCRRYAARPEDCGGCPFQMQCCPKKGYRVIEKPVESAAVQAFRQRMATEEAQALYKQRSRICEYPNMYFKERAGLRRFHVVGMEKAEIEALWVALTFNMVQAIRLRRQNKAKAA
jgi:transposase